MQEQEKLLLALRAAFQDVPRGSPPWAVSSRFEDDEPAIFNEVVAPYNWHEIPLNVVEQQEQRLGFLSLESFHYWFSSFAHTTINSWQDDPESSLSFWSSYHWFGDSPKDFEFRFGCFDKRQLVVVGDCLNFAVRKAEEFERGLFKEQFDWDETQYIYLNDILESKRRFEEGILFCCKT